MDPRANTKNPTIWNNSQEYEHTERKDSHATVLANQFAKTIFFYSECIDVIYYKIYWSHSQDGELGM